MAHPTSTNTETHGANRRLLPPRLGAIIEFTKGEDKQRKVPLIFSRTVIGRKVGDILVRDIDVSSSHLALNFKDDGFRVIDLGSANGTYVEGKKIRELAIEEKMEVRLGETTFYYYFDPEEASRLLSRNPVYSGMGAGGMSQLIQTELFSGRTTEISRTNIETPQKASDMRISLDVIKGPDRGKRFAMQKDQLVMGRMNADVVLTDEDVSRKHALIERQGDGRFLLRDLASTNGTFLNDRKIANSLLHDGDHIRVGQSVLVYYAGDT